MQLPRLKVLTIAVPVLYVLVAEALRLQYLSAKLPQVAISIITVALTLLGAYLFSGVVFRMVEKSQAEALEQEEKLLIETRKRQRQAEKLYQIGLELAGFLELDKKIHEVMEQTRQLFNADLAGWGQIDEDTGEIHYLAFAGARTDQYKQIRFKPGQGFAGRVIIAGCPLKSENFPEQVQEIPESYPIMAAEGIQSAMGAPMKTRGKVFGAIFVGYREPTRFSEQDLLLLSSLATHAAIAAENRSLYRQVQSQAVLEERQRLAGEIHDNLAQLLSFITMRVKDVPGLIDGNRLEQAREVVCGLIEAAEQAHREVRQSIFDLKTAQLDGLDFISAIDENLHEFGLQNRIETELTLGPGVRNVTLHDTAEVQLIRVIQEALNNIRKHANARRAWVKIVLVGDGLLRVAVSDDGRGFDPDAAEKRGHYGLSIMRERAEAVGARLTLKSQPGQGTEIAIDVPTTFRGWNGDAVEGAVG